MTAICHDAEFIERGPSSPIELISVGLAREDGATYYAVSAEFDVPAVLDNGWLREHVWPYLPTVGDGSQLFYSDDGHSYREWLDENHPTVKSRRQIASDVAAFVLGVDDPQLWAWYGAYDHVVLCQLFGRMIDLPKGFPMWTNDLKQEAERLGNPRMPEQDAKEHHALADAQWDLTCWRFLRERAAELGRA